MSVKFTLSKKKSPKTHDYQWYASPRSNYSTGIEGTSSESTQGSTIGNFETEATLRLVGQYIPRELIKGNTVKVPGLGTFRLSFHSKGVEDITKFDAKKMISGAHVVFLPEKTLKSAITNQISFQNAGVKVDNVLYPSVTEYLRAQGIETGTTEPSSGTETPGGTDTPGGGSGGGGTTPDPDDNPDGIE